MRPLVSRAELARLAGVSKPAITKACKTFLADACDGDRVRLDHPTVVAWLKAKGRSVPNDGAPPEPVVSPKPEPPAPTPSKKGKESPPAPPTEGRLSAGLHDRKATADAVKSYMAIVRPLLKRFGTKRNFRDWLLSLKDMEIIREKMLANEETEGRLISRELVRTHVMGAIETANRRLLSDAVKTITRTVYSAAKSGVPVEETEKMVRETISSQLEPVKRAAIKQLRDGPE